MNGANWTDRYPRIIEEAARIKGAAILDAEVVCLDDKGVAQFDTLHSRTADQLAVPCAFDLLMRDGDDLRRRPLIERKAALGKLLIRSRGGIQYIEHAEGHGDKLFEAVCGAPPGLVPLFRSIDPVLIRFQPRFWIFIARQRGGLQMTLQAS
jgi:bifunctional non-homologous end joining protein LigD